MAFSPKLPFFPNKNIFFSCNQPTNGLPTVFLPSVTTVFCPTSFSVTDSGMDYRFVELRCNELCSFPYVQLSHSGLDQPPTYELHAKRRLKMVMDWWWLKLDRRSFLVGENNKNTLGFLLVLVGCFRILARVFDFVFFCLDAFVLTPFSRMALIISFFLCMCVFVHPIKHL